jgi:hypothetical protein
MIADPSTSFCIGGTRTEAWGTLSPNHPVRNPQMRSGRAQSLLRRSPFELSSAREQLLDVRRDKRERAAYAAIDRDGTSAGAGER